MTSTVTYIQQIEQLKRKKNATILAHYYQDHHIQNIADFVGDSLALSREAIRTKSDIIVFAGVHFMAETAKILNPDKKILLPDMDAGCSLADSCSAVSLEQLKTKYPNHLVVTYINSSAEVKALSDVICTSTNARNIIEKIPLYESIIFTPDNNLGRYLMNVTGRDMVLWDGACEVHEAFSLLKLSALKNEYPDSILVAHPECASSLLDSAQYIGSTSGMIDYIKKSDKHTFLVATEIGILHQLTKQVSGKKLIPVPTQTDNSCACSECRYMKLNTIEKLYNCLLNETPEIQLSDTLMKRAMIPLERMFQLSR